MSSITIRDAASGSHACVAVQRGFNCWQFIADVEGTSVNVIAADPNFEHGAGGPSRDGIPLLFPFPNRIRDGRFDWNGRSYQLPLTHGHPHALHGFCLDRPWRTVSQSAASLTARFQLSVDAPDRASLWPADFILDATYSVRAAELLLQLTITNPSDVPLPWGFGTHAYFKLPLRDGGRPDDCRITVPANEEWVLDANLPTGERRPVSDLTDLRADASITGRKLDHVLTDLPATAPAIQTLVRDVRAGLRMVQSFPRDFREVVVFTPPWTSAVCMEPYTCATDAINLQQRGIDGGLRLLPPGEFVSTEISIKVERD